MTRWWIGLEAWIIQDGNYPDFQRGTAAEFAVTFFGPELEVLSEPGVRSANRLEDSHYTIIGQVVEASDRAWVIDCGIQVFRQEPRPPGSELGSWLAGSVYLGVDPFFYFEDLAKELEMPPLIYTWRIEAIFRDTAPYVEIAPRTFTRDSSRKGWEPVEATNAAKDDSGEASYVLECELLDFPPNAPAHQPQHDGIRSELGGYE